MKESALLLFVLIIVSGCATPSGFVQIDPDTFMVSRDTPGSPFNSQLQPPIRLDTFAVR
jgi:hypothetical protein